MSTETLLAPGTFNLAAIPPEQLKAMIEQQEANRQVMLVFMRDGMKDGHDFYSTAPGGTQKYAKPSLSQLGAYKLHTLFNVRVSNIQVDKVIEENGHITIDTYVEITKYDGTLVAVGRGNCSTKEPKYAYRFVEEHLVPAELKPTLDSLPTKGYQAKYDNNKTGVKKGSWVTTYRVPNTEQAELGNTILQMSCKRGVVAATCRLPGVSEIFTQDVNKAIAEYQEDKDEAEQQTGKNQPQQKQPKGEMSEADKETQKLLLDNAEKYLKLLCGDDKEARFHLLPVKDISQLPNQRLAAFVQELKEKADEIRPNGEAKPEEEKTAEASEKQDDVPK